MIIEKLNLINKIEDACIGLLYVFIFHSLLIKVNETGIGTSHPSVERQSIFKHMEFDVQRSHCQIARSMFDTQQSAGMIHFHMNCRG